MQGVAMMGSADPPLSSIRQFNHLGHSVERRRPHAHGYLRYLLRRGIQSRATASTLPSYLGMNWTRIRNSDFV